MSFSATLVLVSAPTPIRLLNVKYSFSQSVDSYNRPNGAVCGGIIDLTLISDHNVDNLAEWMFSETAQKNGSIIFTRRDSAAALRTITFFDAYCIGYEEEFITDNEDPTMQLTLKLSARKVKINAASYNNNWYESSLLGKVMSAGANVGGPAATAAGAASSVASNAANLSDSSGIVPSFNPLD